VDLGLKTARAGTPLKDTVGNVVNTAKLSGTRRMHQLKEFSAARARDLGRKVEKGLIDSAKVIDSGWTATKNVFDQKQIVTPDGTVFRETVENTHAVENIFRAKIDDVKGIGKSTKGTGNGNIVKEVKKIEFGKHIIRGKNGKKQLLPNTKYVTNDNYKYTTDELGRIVNVDAPELVLKKASRNKYAQANVGGKDRLPDDDGGHLIGAQFNGPSDIDNLVPQNSQINRRGGVWYEMETEWANALKEVPPKKVSVSIEPIYSNNSMRPNSFLVEYEIEGQFPVIREIANKSGG